MLLTKFVRGQLIAFAIILVVSVGWIITQYLRVPAMIGLGRSTVELVLPSGAGLYPKSNVTYRGVQAGVVDDLRIEGDKIVVTMYLDDSLDIPTDLDAEVHSRSAIGEQYIELLPRTNSGPYLRDGDTIESTLVPTSTTELVDSLQVGLEDVSSDDLHTLINESGVAFRNSGNDLQQILDGLNLVLDEGRQNLAPTINLIDNAGALLDTQVASADNILSWTGYLQQITSSVASNDRALRGLLVNGASAGVEAADLLDRIAPTLPITLRNVNSVAEVLRIYNMSLEQILVVYPPLAAAAQSLAKGSKPGMINLDFNLDINAPPPCLTGFVPPEQRRSPADPTVIDNQTPNYCAVADSDPYVVRGARNIPCMEVPGVRAADVDACRAGGSVPLGTNPPIGDN
ncbi:phospholipid/cholesterol/gamma-HCH transport system substrate-binding protein [Rhodococcus erythropolis]|uniref:MCE family protein n=1 Tax=Rhodococcus erythropolis TaxID=1833 RepID=UPI00216927A5|nr:MlaD family protein [Rhodococcus erythropolis]MCS4257863.1 phospholipid/cholesterol/gamma-HCH transport system substrate-binding protein [Rhodococcus erythropolis]MCW2425168.1 phospholipid/cholesterol/gamma-HCH transport system substrate-binding protein [Rhodococcus erythropolis]